MIVSIKPVSASLIRDTDTFTRMVITQLLRIHMLLSPMESKDRKPSTVMREENNLIGMTLWSSITQ